MKAHLTGNHWNGYLFFGDTNKPWKKKIKNINCAIYTRKSTSDGLEKEFTTLDAQRESAENYIKSQQYERIYCLPITCSALEIKRYSESIIIDIVDTIDYLLRNKPIIGIARHKYKS